MNRTAIALSFVAAATASAQIRITEWMYAGVSGEFIEFTNIGSTAINVAGWVYDDDSRIASPATATGGSTSGLDLSAFGTIAAGESVVITESSVAAFRAAWNLAASVKVIGGFTNNIGRSDEINLFDNAGNLVDRLRYDDANGIGTIRTQGISGNPLDLTVLGTNNANGWIFSAVGDAYGSYFSSGNEIGNPGQFLIPAPGVAGAMVAAGLVAARRRRA